MPLSPTTEQPAHVLRRLLLLALAALLLTLVPLRVPALADARPANTDDLLAAQAAGDAQWADSFGMLGTDEPVTAATADADGRLYVIVRNRYVLRWDAARWTQIGDVGDSGTLNAIALANGLLYVAGAFTQFDGAPIRALAVWDGALWSQVGSGEGPVISDGLTQAALNALAVVGDTLFVGGHFDRIDGVSAGSIAAWNGATWSALGGGVQKRLIFAGSGQALITPGIVETVVADGDRLYVGGDFKLAGGQEASSIALWRNGAWSALGSGIALEAEREESNEWATVHAIAVSGATVYAGGTFTRAGGSAINNLAAWDGSAWRALGSGISNDALDQVHTLLVQGDTLHVGGRFRVVGTDLRHYARWNGTTWQAGAQLADSVSTEVRTLVSAPGGLYIGGDFNTLDGMLVANVARYQEGAWQALGQGVFLLDSRCCAGQIFATETDAAGRVYVAGRFAYAGGVPANNIAMWDGTRWQALGAGVGDTAGRPVRDLLLIGDELYVAGDFTSAGGAAIAYLARYNTVSGEWSELGGGVIGNGVYTLEFADGQLYIGGDFSSAGGVEANNFAVWDGVAWAAPSDILAIREVGDECRELGTQVHTLKASGRYMVVGGHFRLVQIGFENPCAVSSYIVANNILLWDRIADEWYTLGTPDAIGVFGGGVIFPSVESLAVVGPPIDQGGALYVGGAFDNAGPMRSPNLARYTFADGWQSLGGTTGGTGVYALATAGSDLLVGGSFSAIAGTPAANIARYDGASDGWFALGSGVSTEGGSDRGVYALSLTPDSLFVGGEFTQAGDVSAMAFSRWDAPHVATDIGASGGPLTSAQVSIQLPAGAVADNTSVTIAQRFAPITAAPVGEVLVRGFAVGARTAAGQALGELGRPAVVSVRYSDAELAALGVDDPGSLRVVAWDGTDWVELPTCTGCGVDTTRQIVTATTDRLGEFALVGAGAGAADQFRIFLPLLRR